MASLENCCVRCKDSSKLQCSRCGTDYCSKTCQDIDWLRHCYVCFAKPALIERKTEQRQQTKQKKRVQMRSTSIRNNVLRVLHAPFQQNILPIGKRLVEIFILDVSLLKYGYLSGIRKDKLKELDSIQLYLSKLKQPKTPYLPKCDEYVIAKFEDQWYRGKVVECSACNESFKIIYIDYLNDSWVRSEDIQRYPADLTNDCNTNLMLIDDFPEKITEDIIKCVENEINTDRTILINQVVKVLDECTVVVKSREIHELLKNSKFI